jgi:hypothetical protein
VERHAFLLPGNTEMPLYYQSGEEIRKGDKILLSGLPGDIEFVADPLVPDPATRWYIETCGAGVMIREPEVHGLVFTGETDDDLKFVSRAD